MDSLKDNADKIVEDALEELIGGLNALYPKPATAPAKTPAAKPSLPGPNAKRAANDHKKSARDITGRRPPR